MSFLGSASFIAMTIYLFNAMPLNALFNLVVFENFF